jgi:hypothetical protein
MKLKLASPGMPGQPMCYAVPRRRRSEAGGGVHRARHQPAGPGGRHRQEVQLVSGHRRQEPRRQTRQGGLGQALHRHHPDRPGQNGKPFPDRALFQRHPSRATRRRSPTELT